MNSHLVAFAYMYMAWHWLIKVHGFHVFLEMSTVSSRFIPGEMWKDVASWHCPSILKPKKCQDHKHLCTSGQKFELAIESLTACLVNVANYLIFSQKFTRYFVVAPFARHLSLKLYLLNIIITFLLWWISGARCENKNKDIIALKVNYRCKIQ